MKMIYLMKASTQYFILISIFFFIDGDISTLFTPIARKIGGTDTLWTQIWIHFSAFSAIKASSFTNSLK
jgi:hypothetical protein